ncbi:MAG: AraC family transcriptional regulator, partial [Alistipes sp.]|nr:AraC family transcriptional regulator [Alistipes sp.]
CGVPVHQPIRRLPPPEKHPQKYVFTPEDGRILDEYQLIYLVSGKGIFESTHCKLTKVEAGDIFLLFPGEWHSYHPVSETGWEEYWIGFKGENVDKKVANGFFTPEMPIFRIGISERLVSLYTQSISTAQKQPPGYQQLLAGNINYMLGIVYSNSKRDEFEISKIEDSINRAKLFIQENLHTDITPMLIAENLKINYGYFRRIFKQYTGLSPIHYILEMRILRSKQLLYTTDLNSQQIAFDCGFDDSGYFCTLFRKKVGMSPLQYRHKVRGSEK